MADDTFSTLSLEPASTVERAADELRRALFEGELLPGTPLREVALADSLGVARSTVREALAILVAEGLADRIPNKGTVVRELDPAAIHDVGVARAVIEIAGLSRWSAASEHERDAVREALTAFTRLADRSARTPELTAAHLAIHRSFAALTGSERLLATADGLYAEIRLALAKVDRVRRNANEQVHSHSHLVRMLERGQVEEATAELRAHLAGAEASMVASLGLTP
jgi:DNA-binding GntR family transcriptional regulator